jgi:hypothetical protein
MIKYATPLYEKVKSVVVRTDFTTTYFHAIFVALPTSNPPILKLINISILDKNKCPKWKTENTFRNSFTHMFVKNELEHYAFNTENLWKIMRA